MAVPAFQAIYQKYRPLRFDAVMGQEHITRTLENQLIRGQAGHAYLFTGTRGTGKTTCAKILARAVNCLSPDGANPCNACESCRAILDGAALDVTELDAASNTGVDNIRGLLEEAAYPPAALAKRVYIIDEVHMLSIGAFNALLKTLEEPPTHVLFILATTELHKVPATVLSRCQRFDFRRVPQEIIAASLSDIAAREDIPLTADGARLLGRLGDGSMRDAQSLLERCRGGRQALDEAAVRELLGVAGEDAAFGLLSAVAGYSAGEALRVLDGLYRSGRDMRAVLEECASLLRDVLVLEATGEEALTRGGDPRRLRELSAQMGPGRAEYCVGCLQDALNRMQRAGSGRLETELCLIRMAQPMEKVSSAAGAAEISAGAADSAQVSALTARLEALERRLARQPAQSQPDSPQEQKPSGKAPEKPAEAAEKAASPAKKPAQPDEKKDSGAGRLPEAQAKRFLDALEGKLPQHSMAFVRFAPLCWDGRCLTVVVEKYVEDFFKDAKTRTALENACRTVLGEGARLLVSTQMPEPPAKNEISGFDTVMNNYQSLKNDAKEP